MKCFDLIKRSKAILRENNINDFPIRRFSAGAEWMRQQLNYIRAENKTSDVSSIKFETYGFLKYTFSLSVALIVSAGLFNISVFLLPLAIPVFYFIEGFFLFLFPLMIDGTKDPLFASIKKTTRVGIFYVTINVMMIGIYMITGLINFRNPLQNWYIGCQAILIWHCDES